MHNNNAVFQNESRLREVKI